LKYFFYLKENSVDGALATQVKGKVGKTLNFISYKIGKTTDTKLA
jgi:hypothetical protein